MTILTTMDHKKNEFSNAEKKVYDFIKENYEHIESYTITRVADQAQTSTSAVLRFCQTLGFDGFKDFRFQLINDLKERPKEGTNTIFNALVDGYITTLNSFKTMDQSEMNHLMEDIKKASSISIGGLYYSSLPAKQLSYSLQDIGYMNHLVTDYLELSHLLNVIDTEGVFIYFSFMGGKNNALHYFIPKLKEALPKHSYLITLNNKSPLSEYFEHTITLPGSYLFHNSIIDTESISSIFVEILINMISM